MIIHIDLILLSTYERNQSFISTLRSLTVSSIKKELFFLFIHSSPSLIYRITRYDIVQAY